MDINPDDCIIGESNTNNKVNQIKLLPILYIFFLSPNATEEWVGPFVHQQIKRTENK